MKMKLPKHQAGHEERGMFTIDLLKGQGVPPRSGPGSIAIVAVTAAVPFLIAMALLDSYLHGSIVEPIRVQEIIKWETEIGKLSDAAELHESLEKEKAIYRDCLSEVKSSIGRYIQWSSVLATLVENMPDSVVLTELEVERKSIKKKVPKRDKPEEMTDIDIPIRTLRVTVSGSSQHDCDKAVKDFRDRLYSSALLGPKLESIGVSQEADKLDGHDIIYYEINCVFKPGL
jgi:hypothetical protein